MPLVELPGFREAVERHTWGGGVLPVLYDGERICGRCQAGRVVTVAPFVEDALFFHGGYGESVRKTVDVCLACHHATLRIRESVRPPR